MLSPGTVRSPEVIASLSASVLAVFTLLGAGWAVAQDSSNPDGMGEESELEMPVEVTPNREPSNPQDTRPLSLESSFLSVQGGERLLAEASEAIADENYDEAAEKLQEARQIFNQLSNFYQQLATSFSGIDNRIADEHRNRARDTAQLRDNATYQLALVHRAQNQPELAVPLLVQIIRSQAPTRDLGKKAYQQLLELGFVSTPLPGGAAPEQSTSSNPQ
ncbi:hypothetical protein [Lyngbya sp. CCY1209]|uniref:hypothetical protein n=1 Tax=Lyngbya sp. CCY1209 TaxID=2886103 RepID=UPI0035C8DA6C